MKDGEHLTLDDIERLETLVREATQALADSGSSISGEASPDDSRGLSSMELEILWELADSILRSSWFMLDYDPRITRRTLANLETATLEQIRSAVMHIARVSDRKYSPAIKGYLDAGVFGKAVQRAREILGDRR